MGVDTFGQPMADRAQLDDAFETRKGLFDDVLVKVKREHLVQRQRTSAEQAGVTIELFGRSQLGGPQMASGIEEPLQAGFDALALGQKFLGIENLVAARLPQIPLSPLIQTQSQLAAHTIELIGTLAARKNGRAP